MHRRVRWPSSIQSSVCSPLARDGSRQVSGLEVGEVPGLVSRRNAEMGGPNAPNEVEDAVAKHIKIYERAAVGTHTGKFINLDGEETEW